jgi:hypothetical protein
VLDLGNEACRGRRGPLDGAPVFVPHAHAPASLALQHVMLKGEHKVQ